MRCFADELCTIVTIWYISLAPFTPLILKDLVNVLQIWREFSLVFMLLSGMRIRRISYNGSLVTKHAQILPIHEPAVLARTRLSATYVRAHADIPPRTRQKVSFTSCFFVRFRSPISGLLLRERSSNFYHHEPLQGQRQFGLHSFKCFHAHKTKNRHK